MNITLKKTTVILLAIMLALGSTISIIAAEVSHRVDNNTISEGEDVTVTLTLDETLEGVMSFEFCLYFEEGVFTLKSAANGSAHPDITISELKTDKKNGQTYYSVNVIDPKTEGLTIAAGTVYTLVFTATDDVSESTDAIFKLVNKGVYSADFTAQDVTVIADVTVNIHKCDFGTGTVTSKPTCTEEGVRTYTCSCGDIYTVTIPATGHTTVNDPEKAPTCTETGLTAGSHCSVCGEVFEAQNTVAATGHTYGDWVETTTPTCDTIGVERRDCTACDHYETRQIGYGHDLSQQQAKTPTCTEIGWNAYEACSKCDYSTYTEISATGHSYTHTVVPPTTAAEGYTLHTCSVCGDSYKDTFVDKLTYIVGDADSNETINKDDAIFLLMHTFFPAEYPLVQECDFDNNGSVNKDDAIYLLMYTFFPSEYPLT